MTSINSHKGWEGGKKTGNPQENFQKTVNKNAMKPTMVTPSLEVLYINMGPLTWIFGKISYTLPYVLLTMNHDWAWENEMPFAVTNYKENNRWIKWYVTKTKFLFPLYFYFMMYNCIQLQLQ